MFRTLIDAATLSALSTPQIFIADCRFNLVDPSAGEVAYAQGHLPGACYLHLDRDLSGVKTGRNGRHPLPDREVLAAKLRACGLKAGQQVVAYDDSGGMFAARLWWLLRWMGHRSVAVLDGGLNAWKAVDGRFEVGAPPLVCVGDFVPTAQPVTEVVGADDLAQALSRRGDVVLVDARSPDRFRGENETLDPVGGHIPGAVNHFFMNNLDETCRFRSPSQLRAAWLAVLGDTPPSQVIHQCGSGVTACVNVLAMEVAGLSGSAIYPGSWSEWCADAARPVARGDA